MLLLIRGLNQDRLLYIIQYHICRSWKVVGEALLLSIFPWIYVLTRLTRLARQHPGPLRATETAAYAWIRRRHLPCPLCGRTKDHGGDSQS